MEKQKEESRKQKSSSSKGGRPRGLSSGRFILFQGEGLIGPAQQRGNMGNRPVYDTAANGFENLGGRSGPAGSAAVADLTQPVAVDTEAHLVALELQPGTVLRELVLEAVANDVIFGLIGATILK